MAARKVSTRALIKGFVADEKKVELKVQVDTSDVGACEGLMNLRGRVVVMTIEDTQESLLDGDYE